MAKDHAQFGKIKKLSDIVEVWSDAYKHFIAKLLPSVSVK